MKNIKFVLALILGVFFLAGSFFMGHLAIPVVIVGLICIIVGVFVSVMWISSAFATMYHAVETQDGIPEYHYPAQ